MPELICEACQSTWTAGVDDLNRSDYWHATLQFATLYATDVFFSFEEMKMAAPGPSCQAFLRIQNQPTVRFGRVSIEFIYPAVLLISLSCWLISKISADSFLKSLSEWEAVRFEVDNICKEEPFNCPACTLDMLAVSVDGNRKHYRFKNAASYSKLCITVFVLIRKHSSLM